METKLTSVCLPMLLFADSWLLITYQHTPTYSSLPHSPASPSASCLYPLNLLHFPESSLLYTRCLQCDMTPSHSACPIVQLALQVPRWSRLPGSLPGSGWGGVHAVGACCPHPWPLLSQLTVPPTPYPQLRTQPLLYLCHWPWLCRAQNHPFKSGGSSSPSACTPNIPNKGLLDANPQGLGICWGSRPPGGILGAEILGLVCSEDHQE